MKTFSVFALAVALAAALFSGCAPSGREAPELPGRPGPAYIQWLEEQACLRRAVSVTSVVSGSSLNWRRGSRASLLPEDARTWFFASPALTAWSGSDSLTEALVGEHAEARLAGLGVQGVLLADLADTGDEWAGRSPAAGLGTDGVGLSLGRLAGTEESFSRWKAALAGKGLLSGGTLLPADTGAGPDFFLSLRGGAGLSRAVRHDRNFSAALASSSFFRKGGNSSAFRERSRRARRAGGAAFRAGAGRRFRAAARLGGHGAGGRRGRSQTALGLPLARAASTGPVLHWDDPSGAARRVMEAGLIDQIGLRHEALIGVSVDAWLGLDGPNDVTGHGSAGGGP